MTVYYKIRLILLQNATTILLQKATEIYYKRRQDFYYKMRQFYYNMRQLLQIATILLQNPTVITKCDVNYKLNLILSIPVSILQEKLRKYSLLYKSWDLRSCILIKVKSFTSSL